MHKLKILLGLTLSILLFTNCDKEEPIENSIQNNFQPEFEIINKAKTYQKNDTIWLQSIVPYALLETNSNEEIIFFDANLTINCIIRQWGSSNNSPGKSFTNLRFNTTCNYLSNTQNAQLLGLTYHGIGDSLILDIGISILNTGTYSIDFDYLELENDIENTSDFYGGGFIQYYDLTGNYSEGYLTGVFKHDNNIELYHALNDDAKSKFQAVDENNSQQYYFVSIN